MRIVISILLLCFSLISVAVNTNDKKDSVNLQEKLSEEKRFEFDFSFAEAVKFKIIGDYRSSIKWFNNCLKIDPQSSAVRYELSNIYLVNNDYNTALSLMRDAVKFNSHNIWYKMLLANILQNKAMVDKACGVYDEIFEENPDKHEFLFVQANLYASVEQWKKAIKVYDRIEEIKGVSEPVSFEKYKLFVKLGSKSKARKEILKLIKEFPEKSDYLGLLAELYIKTDDESKALKIFDKMLKLNPDNGFVHFYLADYFRGKKDFKKSNEHLLNALKSSSVKMDIKLQYVYRLFTNKNSTDLSDNFIRGIINTLLTNYPDDPDVIALYVDYLMATNNVKEARKNIYKVLKYNKYNYKLWNDLLMIDNGLGDFKAQYEDASEAIKYFPDEPFPYLSKGVVYLNDGKYEKALPLLEKGNKLCDDSDKNKGVKLMFYIYIGEAYYNTGKIKESFKLFDKALEIDPANVGVLNNYAYYLGLRNEELEKAERMISRCIELEGNEPTYLDTYAYILFKRGKYSMAKFMMKKAIEKKPSDPDFWEHYGDIEFKMGNQENAMEFWKKARELKGKGEFLDKKIETGKYVD